MIRQGVPLMVIPRHVMANGGHCRTNAPSKVSDRTRMMPAFIALVLALYLGLAGSTAMDPTAAAQPAPAQPAGIQAQSTAGDTGLGGSFITPFPDNETYRLQLFGENISDGLLPGLLEALAKEPRLQIAKKNRQLANLIRGGDGEDLKAIETELAGGEPPHIAIVTLNMIYRFPWRDNFDRRFPPGSEARQDEIDRRRGEWKAQYGARLDRLMRAFRRKNVAVYWVGMPIMRTTATTEDAQAINDLIRERALQNGGKFIDIDSSFADENGAYSQQGPDIDGKPRVLREQDQFTAYGYRKLAHFVERVLKRDLALARTERVIPLAGSETEQHRVRPATTVPVSALTGGPKAQPASASQKEASLAGVLDRSLAQPRAGDGAGDVRADNSRIHLRSVNQQGKEDVITIDIVRPAIPAPVLAAVTRRESADKPSQMGDAVLLEIRGGQTLVSSVTASAEASGDKRRSGGGNSPYLLVLEKGERLPPKPGRSDDMPWPRIEVLPPQPVKAPEGTAARPGSMRGAPKIGAPR